MRQPCCRRTAGLRIVRRGVRLSAMKNRADTHAEPCGSSFADSPDIAVHEARLDAFVSGYLAGPHSPMLDLKFRHSKLVFANAREIVDQTGLGGETARAALLAALYHDTGRFPQFERWQTFSDAVSVDHGKLGARVVRREKMLAGETPSVKGLVLAAVALHNRYVLPAMLSQSCRTVANVVRDADKLDIIRIMTEHINAERPTGEVVLSVRNEPDRWSPAIVQKLLHGEVPNYTELKFVNDFRMLLGSWLNELNFAPARRRLALSGHLELVLSGLPDAPELRPVLSLLYGRIERAKHGDSLGA